MKSKWILGIWIVGVLWVGGLFAQTPDVERAPYQEIQQAIRTSEAEVKVVNFWATWCGPCIEEFPAFVKLGKTFDTQQVEVIFVSMDFEDEMAAVKAFLKEQGWMERSYLRTGKDHRFIPAFHEDWTGALPTTFLYGPEDQVLTFWEGKATAYEDLKARVMDALQTTSSASGG